MRFDETTFLSFCTCVVGFLNLAVGLYSYLKSISFFQIWSMFPPSQDVFEFLVLSFKELFSPSLTSFEYLIEHPVSPYASRQLTFFYGPEQSPRARLKSSFLLVNRLWIWFFLTITNPLCCPWIQSIHKDIVMLWYKEIIYLVFVPRSWHRASQTLVIF